LTGRRRTCPPLRTDSHRIDLNGRPKRRLNLKAWPLAQWRRLIFRAKIARLEGARRPGRSLSRTSAAGPAAERVWPGWRRWVRRFARAAPCVQLITLEQDSSVHADQPVAVSRGRLHWAVVIGWRASGADLDPPSGIKKHRSQTVSQSFSWPQQRIQFLHRLPAQGLAETGAAGFDLGQWNMAWQTGRGGGAIPRGDRAKNQAEIVTP